MFDPWSPIIVGVDTSVESLAAVETGAAVARAARVDLQLVHAVRDQAAEVAPLQLPMDLGPMTRMLADAAREDVHSRLQEAVPASTLARLEVRAGRPSAMIARFAEERQASLIVLGGKHHSTLGRWLGGSTSHELARLSAIPVLVTGSGAPALRRVLVAVDFSPAASPTLALAQRMVRLFSGDLLVLHVVDTSMLGLGGPLGESLIDRDEIVRRSEELFEQGVWPLVDYTPSDRVVRAGSVVQSIREQAGAWRADLVVVGSHGKSWADRVLVGSATERLISDLPASVLVTPVRTPVRRALVEPRIAAATA